uniref:p36 protein (CAK component) n=1 Tax=Xenopus sp. TaxID=8356 RepID=Q7LZJ3_9PIPI
YEPAYPEEVAALKKGYEDDGYISKSADEFLNRVDEFNVSSIQFVGNLGENPL